MTVDLCNVQAIDSEARWLIVTDLDGTLLDHFDYNHRAVDPLLQQLERQNVPVVFNSSKTALELVWLRREFDNRHPFIVENGSALYFPQSYFDQYTGGKPPHSLQSQAIEGEQFWALTLGADRKRLLDFLAADRQQYGGPYLNFSDASTEELMAATGLSAEKIAQSQQRQYSEPLLWRGSDDARALFKQRARAAGFNTLQGGRFLHLLGRCDKGRATEALVKILQRQSEQDWRIIAAGDSANDIDMLQCADVAVVIRSPTHAAPAVPNHQRVLVSSATGPEGWNQIIDKLFDMNQ